MCQLQHRALRGRRAMSEFVTRTREADHSVEAVMLEPAPNRGAGTKLKSWSERREKDSGSAVLASRRWLAKAWRRRLGRLRI